MVHLGVWFETNWFNVVQTASIVIGLVFAGLSLRRDAHTRRLSNLLVLKQEHRELWSSIHSRPELARILDFGADLVASPVTIEEEIFLRQLIVHVATSWELMRDGTPLDRKGFGADVGAFFALPIPKSIWEKTEEFQSRPFRQFVGRATKLYRCGKSEGLVEQCQGRWHK